MKQVKYIGVNQEVKFQGIIFKKNVWQDCNISVLPFDFEIKRGKEDKIEPKKQEVSEFSKLLKIKGIGEETLEDIKKIYGSINDLKEALFKDKCPLRNDICIKLKESLL